MRQRRFQRHVAAAERAVVVVRLPTVDVDGGAADGRVRRHAPFDRRAVNERLERRTSLAISLVRVVEFVREKIVAADHRYDLAGLRIQSHQRALHAGNLG